MKKWFKRLKDQKGMTLVELLAVVLILGIVAAIAVPAIGNIINNSKADAHRSNALMIINAAKLAEASNELTITETGVSIKQLKDKGFLESVPADPSVKGTTYHSNASLVKKTTEGYLILLKANNGNTYFENISESKLNAGEEPK